jgi:methyl-CpG-binding domain protein 4
MSEPLIQLKYRRQPWRLLVACVLLNRTRGSVADPVIRELFRRWPDAVTLSGADRDELAELLRPLGLHNNRAGALIALSAAWPRRRLRRADVLRLPGLGPYAADAYELLVLGDLSVVPEDRELLRWWSWAVFHPPRWAT